MKNIFILCLLNSLSAYADSLIILPQDGRTPYFEAFAQAQHEIRIEICVLEDPLILQSLQQALLRGVRVKVNVDRGKYNALPIEQLNLALYLTSTGGELHLSNPIFPRSFPKVIIIDDFLVIIGTACLDSTTFSQYRDYAYISHSASIIKSMSQLFENDWSYSAPPNLYVPDFNPTPPITQLDILISPVNSSSKLVSFIQSAQNTLDITSELLGNPTLESELAKSATTGVRVRLIAPEIVNSSTPSEQALQIASLQKLRRAGIDVHVTQNPQSFNFPYMHARTAIADGCVAYLGSISLSPDSITFNREVGLILYNPKITKQIQEQFNIDFHTKSVAF